VLSACGPKGNHSLSGDGSAQIAPGDKVHVIFKDTPNEVNVDGANAVEMLKSYIHGKTTLKIVNSREESSFTFVLSIYEKNMGNRKGKIDLVDSASNAAIFESKLKTGTMNAFYGFSGSRHVIGRVFNGQILKTFPKIKRR
jgi:hypothetical protein